MASERKKAYLKAYWEANRPRLLAQQKEYRQNRRDNVKHAADQRKFHLEYTYGLTVDQFNEMLAQQDNRCASCDEVFGNTPHVDHCHSTGAVRSLLCRRCNTTLGYFEDAKLVANQRAYLARYGVSF